ncbi:hypothetical protein AMK27_27140 [Streptomyces sp. CB02009]|uniref:hypothetical protein n=1 Tax=Streptomyces sp. CB02009 TaxID=1703938 RepID=UPI000939DFAE|nr:hypothetical protein [Streptomyces sp. CB02009]OKJ54838.1 hypothetical protein AMK27_27140 [Streptomyces sp. CB02009]
MTSAPLRPRSPRALTAAAALTVTATAHLALASPALAAPAPSVPPTTAPAPAQAAPDIPAPDPPAPTCGTPSGSAFPLDTRIHGGPADYPAGGPLQEWKLDLTNTTDATCSGIHPVLVLTDEKRVLKPAQIRFEFYDAGAARWRPVTFEATEQAENIGVFSTPEDAGRSAGSGVSSGSGTSGGSGASDGPEGFDGFMVPAGGTLTVPVRLGFRAETAPDQVVVNAAVVQRRGVDGDWVGESGDYRLAVVPAVPADPDRSTGADEPAPDTSGTPDPGTRSRPPGATPRPPGSTAEDSGDLVLAGPDNELAETGRESGDRARFLAPLAAALVLLGAVLFRAARRPRHR